MKSTNNNLIIGSDHGGFALKEQIKAKYQDYYTIQDVGCDSEESCDYPTFGKKVGEGVIATKNSLGIAICGSGVGICIAANKVPGIRAGNMHTSEETALACEHNDINVLCLGARTLGSEVVLKIIDTFLTTNSDTAERHARRRKGLDQL